MSDWCILRTASTTTLRLAEGLREAGYEAWTPLVARQWREGESRTRKSEMVPGTLGYVFARYRHLSDLIALSHSPSLGYRVWDAVQRRMVSRGHPKFTVHWDNDRYSTVTDQELNGLRSAERQGMPKEKARPFKAGEHIKVIDGPWQGLFGWVLRVSGVHVKIDFPDSALTPNLPFWQLQHMDELEKAA